MWRTDTRMTGGVKCNIKVISFVFRCFPITTETSCVMSENVDIFNVNCSLLISFIFRILVIRVYLPIIVLRVYLPIIVLRGYD